MSKTRYQKTLFIFRRDLRIEDNTGLLFALKNSTITVPCFIFTPQQIEQNPYRSDRCLQFMIESLEDLEGQLKKRGGRLYLFFSHPEQIIERCVHTLHVDAVIANRDYTPYSVERDAKITKTCHHLNIPFLTFDDALLHPPEATLKKDKTPYTLFTPFYRNASKIKIAPPVANHYKNYYTKPISFAQRPTLYTKILPKRKQQVPGGRTACKKILQKIGNCAHYASLRDFLGKQGTTHLSAHLKFTTCSPREIYYAITKHSSALVRSLYWRDFFSSLTLFFPHVFQGPFHKKFAHIRWSDNKTAFKRWCSGKTGVPIVDAGMRELNQTGYMHNRARMITASFLVKDLHINWQWGEKYFAQTLIDYDPSVNNGNWQWVASTGADAQPYFRIFNPWMQQRKFDADCTYIKKWIPELAQLAPKEIHSWYLEKYHDQAPDYPPPMVDHAQESQKALKNYRASSRTTHSPPRAL